jgi:hypothetical protein
MWPQERSLAEDMAKADTGPSVLTFGVDLQGYWGTSSCWKGFVQQNCMSPTLFLPLPAENQDQSSSPSCPSFFKAKKEPPTALSLQGDALGWAQVPGRRETFLGDSLKHITNSHMSPWIWKQLPCPSPNTSTSGPDFHLPDTAATIGVPRNQMHLLLWLLPSRGQSLWVPLLYSLVKAKACAQHLCPDRKEKVRKWVFRVSAKAVWFPLRLKCWQNSQASMGSQFWCQNTIK